MKELREQIYEYISGYNPEGENIIKSIFAKTLNKPEYQILKAREDFEDLYSSFYEEKIILKRKLYEEKFKEDKSGIINYLKASIRHFLDDEKRKLQIETISVIKDEEDNQIDIFETIPDTKIKNQLDYIEAKEISEKIKKFLSEEDLKVLCHIVFKDKNDKNYCLENLSQDAIYKRVERLKKEKLTKFVSIYNFSYDGFQLFIDEFLMSEICKKLCL